MKQCPFCAEEIQDAAIICRYCQRDLPKGDEPVVVGGVVVKEGTAPAPIATPAPPKKKTSPATMLLAVFFALLGLAWLSAIFNPPPDPPQSEAGRRLAAAAAAGAAAKPKLEILSSRGYTEYGHHFVEGEVKNVSSETLEHVTAVVSWYTDSGTLVKTDTALIEFDPILPGQTSPFKTGTTSNPEMKRFSVAFKHLIGGAIQTRDVSK